MMKLIKDARFYRFLIPSLIGAFLFVTPISLNGALTIPIAVAANKLLALMGGHTLTIIWVLISVSAAVTLLHRFLGLGFLRKNPKLDALFCVKGFWFWTRMVGFVFANMIYFGIGPEFIIGELTGGLVINDLIPILVCVFLLAGVLLALLLTQIVAFPCAILFGKLSAKHDSAKLMKICIICYTGITLFAVFLVSQWQFWVLATLVGMFQGAIQALSRSYLGKIVSVEQSGEFYGLMDICGKGASIVGMTLVSFVNQITDGLEVTVFGLRLQNSNIAVGTLVILFVVGYVLFCKADKLNKERMQ